MASHLENYVDPDQLATDRAIGSGLTLFSTILENYAYYLNFFFGYCFRFIKYYFAFNLFIYILLVLFYNQFAQKCGA